jgi:protein tyrosine phosphatase (PTP) superfamily phosphohydrolase (DUF442 family)
LGSFIVKAYNPPQFMLALTTKTTVLLLLIGLAIAAGAIIFWYTRTYHFREIDPGKLYRDGLRNSTEFANACRKGHIHSIISLVSDEEYTSARFAPAIAAARTGGIQTLRVPIPLGGWPTTEDLHQFLALATDPANQPAIVHCREGVRRTGMLISAYRITVMGMSKDKAKAAIETFGHSRRSIGDIERFIDLYDPATRSVTYPTNMPKGDE